MPTCTVCAGTEFALDAGFYHCVECGTQSQEVRELVVDADDPAVGAGNSTFSRGVVVSEETRARRQLRRQRHRQQRRPARTPLPPREHVNLLLQGWVETLQRAGAPARLAEHALQLWAYCLAHVSPRRPRSALFSPRAALVMLWLAMRQCDERCLLSDLLRWARHGTIHVYSAANEVPEDLKFTDGVLQYMCQGGQGAQYRLRPLGALAGRLLRALRLPPPQLPPPTALLPRLLRELALPQQLGSVAAQLATRLPAGAAAATLTPELEAAALLLFTLKLLLALDGLTERRNSRVAAAHNAARPDAAPWFDFCQWLAHLRACRAAVGLRRYADIAGVEPADPCQQQHRRLCYQFFREEGVHWNRHESAGTRCSATRRRFLQRTASLFGATEPESRLPPDDHLFSPLACWLPPALRRASAAFQRSSVDFLLDGRHVERLAASCGLRVTVVDGPARSYQRRDPPASIRRAEHITLTADAAQEFVCHQSSRPSPPAAAAPAAGASCPADDPETDDEDELRLHLPASQLWLASACGHEFHASCAAEDAPPPPAAVQLLQATLSQLVEVSVGQLACAYCCVERQLLLGPAATSDSSDERSEDEEERRRRRTPGPRRAAGGGARRAPTPSDED